MIVDTSAAVAILKGEPEAEWDETMNKGRALFRAVAEAARGL